MYKNSCLQLNKTAVNITTVSMVIHTITGIVGEQTSLCPVCLYESQILCASQKGKFNACNNSRIQLKQLLILSTFKSNAAYFHALLQLSCISVSAVHCWCFLYIPIFPPVRNKQLLLYSRLILNMVTLITASDYRRLSDYWPLSDCRFWPLAAKSNSCR